MSGIRKDGVISGALFGGDAWLVYFICYQARNDGLPQCAKNGVFLALSSERFRRFWGYNI